MRLRAIPARALRNGGWKAMSSPARCLEPVRRILAKHYVHRIQAELLKSTIKERGTHKVIDKLTVELNDKGGFYEVEFTNLGLKKVPIDVASTSPISRSAWKSPPATRLALRKPSLA
jgi:hypothetical protein